MVPHPMELALHCPIGPHIDLDQLVALLNIIHSNPDKNYKELTAVLVDFSKAFNRMNNNILITILSDLNFPTCDLPLIICYLSKQKMCVQYNCA